MVPKLIHSSSRVSPISLFIALTIHDITRSKKLILILHRLGICINYKDILGIDSNTAERVIKKTSSSRVLVSNTIDSTAVIHGTMDHFNHEENILSGTHFEGVFT